MSVKLLYNHIVFYISDLPIRGRSTFLFLPANKVAECIFLEAGQAATPLLRYMPPRGLGHLLGPGQCSQHLTMLPILDISSYSSPMIVLVFIIPIVYSPTLPSPFFLSPLAQGNHNLTVLAVSFNLWSAILCDGPNAISRSSNQLAEEIHDLVRHWAAFLYKMALLSISSCSTYPLRVIYASTSVLKESWVGLL